MLTFKSRVQSINSVSVNTIHNFLVMIMFLKCHIALLFEFIISQSTLSAVDSDV